MEDSRAISAIEYEAFHQMARHQFILLFEEAGKRWPLESIRLVHRVGHVEVGEASIWAEVVAAHREEAFAACQFIIGEMKRVVPIWETAEGGQYWPMTGAILNAAGIVVGGIWALIARRPIPATYQLALKIILGVYAVWFGLKLSWGSINGSIAQAAKELCIVLLAMTLGKMAGKLLRLQKLSNFVGQYASSVLAAPPANKRFGDGFVMATALFCIGPLAVLASVQEGLTGFSPVFLVKAATDGLATYAFCATFGWGVMASAIPVLALEGTLIRPGAIVGTLLARAALGRLSTPSTLSMAC